MAARAGTGASEGYSLVEMLVALSISGVLAGLAIPAAVSARSQSRVAAAAHEFLSHLHLARSESIKRQEPVVLCTSVDGATCVASGGWQQGWIVFRDSNRNSVREPGEAVLQHGDALSPTFSMWGNLNVSRYIAFMPSGATRTSTGAFQAGTLTICRRSASATVGRQIVLNAVGRPRVQKIELSRCD